MARAAFKSFMALAKDTQDSKYLSQLPRTASRSRWALAFRPAMALFNCRMEIADRKDLSFFFLRSRTRSKNCGSSLLLAGSFLAPPLVGILLTCLAMAGVRLSPMVVNMAMKMRQATGRLSSFGTWILAVDADVVVVFAAFSSFLVILEDLMGAILRIASAAPHHHLVPPAYIASKPSHQPLGRELFRRFQSYHLHI